MPANKNKEPDFVYYIKSGNYYTGPYSNKPSKLMLRPYHNGTIVKYHLIKLKDKLDHLLNEH